MKLKRISLFTIILSLILSFTTYSMETFNIEDKWNINLPEEWRMEEKSSYQQYYSFYPNIPFYSLIKIYNYGIQENQNIDFSENLKKEYPSSKIKEKKLDLNKFKIKNVKINAYDYSFDENGAKLYAISCYIFSEENLLIVNFYSTSKKETEKMFKNIYSVEKIN